MSPGRGAQAWQQVAPVGGASAVAWGTIGSGEGHQGTEGSGPKRNRKEASRGRAGPSWDRSRCVLRLEADSEQQEGARGPGHPLHRSQLSLGGPQAGPREKALWAAMQSRAFHGSLTQEGAGTHVARDSATSARSSLPGRAGTYRRAEVAAARTALVLHHPAPVVFTQHQEGRPAGWAHELMLDHAVGAPAQLEPDRPGSGGRGTSGGMQRGGRASSSARPP